MMTNILDQCRWPDLAPPYDQALQEAVAYILNRFQVLGIVAAGSIIRGVSHKSSDFDIYVVHTQSQRQRLQKFFQGVPAEIFVNPAPMIEGYFREERKEGRPCTAHMFVTGFVVLDTDKIVHRLRQQAQTTLERPPNPSEAQLTSLRYFVADRYENARDIAATQPLNASMMLGLTTYEMLRYAFWKANCYLPRDKDLLEETGQLDPSLADLAREFYATANLERRLELAEQMATRTIETHGFFEWESALEDVSDKN